MQQIRCYRTEAYCMSTARFVLRCTITWLYLDIPDNCWRSGSVVRMSVFGRRTFHDLCPIYCWLCG